MRALGTDRTIFCPAFPENRRTVYMGDLVVGYRLLNDSGIQNRPLTPMTGPDLCRWLRARVGGGGGLLRHSDIAAGQVGRAPAAEVAVGRPLIACDALNAQDLLNIGQAVA